MRNRMSSLLTAKRRRVLLHLAAGFLSLQLSLSTVPVAQAQTGVCFDEFPNLLRLLGTSGADTLNGNNSSERICGLQGNDTIRANGGNDKVVGNEGKDTISGGNGDDLLRGGKDNDWIEGDPGADTLFGDLGDDSLHGSYGNDQMYGGDGNDYLNGDYEDDTINGENGIDTLSGYTGNDTLNGNAGNDTLYGDTGNDTVNGGQNDDLVSGGWGTDNVAGDLGNDRVYGNWDNDNLWGGDGKDIFYYNQNDGYDVIWDFRIGTDILKLFSITQMSTRREGNDCLVSIDGYFPGSILIKNVTTCSGIVSSAATAILPSLTVNAAEGAPGSVFTITGAGFTPGASRTLALNDQAWITVQADATGRFALLLDTREALADMYLITDPAYQQTAEEMSLSLDPVAVQFALNPSADVLTEQIVDGISPEATYRLTVQKYVYLPLVQSSEQ